MKYSRFRLLICFVGAMWCQYAYADCTTSGSNFQNLGAFPSTDIASQSLDFTFSSNFACDGFVNLLDFSRIDATLVAANFQLSANNGDAIPYVLFTDAAFSDPFLVGETVEFGSFNLLDLLGLFSNVDGSLPLYLQTLPANVAAGSYQDTIAIRWDWDYCSGVSVLFICLGRDSGSEVITLTLELTVENTCQLTSQDTAFGSVSDLSLARQAPLPVETLCTKSLSFNIYIDGGNNFSSGVRNMVNANAMIPYLIYAPDGVTSVGPTAVNSVNFMGSGNFEVLSFIAKTQATTVLPSPGVYTDTVRVILNY